MSFILKVVDGYDQSPVDSDNACSLHADLTSVSFRRHEDGSATALCYVRDAVKTAAVPGFVEHEVRVSFIGRAYVMNEQGKTIQTFTSHTSGDPRFTETLFGKSPPLKVA